MGRKVLVPQVSTNSGKRCLEHRIEWLGRSKWISHGAAIFAQTLEGRNASKQCVGAMMRLAGGRGAEKALLPLTHAARS